MQVDVKVYKGFKIIFVDTLKEFRAIDEDGHMEAKADTVEELEKKIGKLGRAKFTPIRVIHVTSYGTAEMGKITSVNEEDRSCRFVCDPPPPDSEKRKGLWGYSPHSHSKVNLRYDSGNYFEYSVKNVAIADQIMECKQKSDALGKKIEKLSETLEKPISLEYFGLTAGY